MFFFQFYQDFLDVINFILLFGYWLQFFSVKFVLGGFVDLLIVVNKNVLFYKIREEFFVLLSDNKVVLERNGNVVIQNVDYIFCIVSSFCYNGGECISYV